MNNGAAGLPADWRSSPLVSNDLNSRRKKAPSFLTRTASWGFLSDRWRDILWTSGETHLGSNLVIYRWKKAHHFWWAFLKVLGEEGFDATGLPAPEYTIIFSPDRKKAHHFWWAFLRWSVKRDSNPRPSGPKPDALPSCAIHRDVSFDFSNWKLQRSYQN